MKRYLLDTNHASALIGGDPRLEARRQSIGRAELSLSVPTLGELWYMVFNSAREVENRRQLERLIRRSVIYPYDPDAAEQSGRIRTELRRMGRPIPAIDAQIAAIARNRELTVLSSDRHFRQVPGLELEDWLSA